MGRINYFTEPEATALLDLKEKWGFDDPRGEMKNCDICANDVFRDSWTETGVKPSAFPVPQLGTRQTAPAQSSNGTTAGTADQEALIQTITERVMAALNGR